MADQYTVVQHSAWVGNRDPQFEHALETRSVNKKQAEAVRKAGGVVFDGYTEADDYAMEEQYRGVDGLIARAPGTFSTKQVDGMPIYLPPKDA